MQSNRIIEISLLLVALLSCNAVPVPCNEPWNTLPLSNYDTLTLSVSLDDPSQAYNRPNDFISFVGLSGYTSPIVDCGTTPIGQNCSSRLELIQPPTYSSCYTEYICDFDRNRIPQHICQAECKQGCLNCNGNQECSKVYNILPILRTHTPEACLNEIQFTWSLERIAVACTCQPKDSCPMEE